jgi:anti-sigma factor ChrR (cupin superfamily)
MLEKNEERWETCPTGAIARLGERLRRGRRRRMLLKASGAVAAASIVGGVLFVQHRHQSTGQLAALTCDEALRFAAAFREGTLDEATRAKVAAHVHHCETCRERFRKLGLVS